MAGLSARPTLPQPWWPCGPLLGRTPGDTPQEALDELWDLSELVALRTPTRLRASESIMATKRKLVLRTWSCQAQVDVRAKSGCRQRVPQYPAAELHIHVP